MLVLYIDEVMMQCPNLREFTFSDVSIPTVADAAISAAHSDSDSIDSSSPQSCESLLSYASEEGPVSSATSWLWSGSSGSSDNLAPGSCENLGASPVEEDGRSLLAHSRTADGTGHTYSRFLNNRQSLTTVSIFRPDEIQRIETLFSQGNHIVAINDALTADGEFIALEYAKLHCTNFKRTIILNASSESAFYFSCFEQMKSLQIPPGEYLDTCTTELSSWLKKHPHTLLVIHSLHSETIALQINTVLKNTSVKTLIIDNTGLIEGERLELRRMTFGEVSEITSDEDLTERFGYYPPALHLCSGYEKPLSSEVNGFESLFDEIYAQLSPEAQKTLRYLGCFHPQKLPTQGRPAVEELIKHRLISNNQMLWDVHRIVSMRCSKSDCEDAYLTLSKWGVNHYLYHLDHFLQVAKRVGFSCEIFNKRESILHLKLNNWAALGDDYLNQYQFSEALNAYESACLLRSRPSAELLRKLGEMQFNVGQIQPAMQTLNNALPLAFDNMTKGRIKGILAQLYLQLDDFSKADQFAQEALTALATLSDLDLWIAPTLTRCAILLAQKKFSEGRPLLQSLEKTLSGLHTDPCWIGLQLLKGYFNLYTNKHGVDCQKIVVPPNLQNHPIRYEVAYLEGLIYLYKKDYEKAVEKLEETLQGLKQQLGTENHPRIAECHLGLQQAYKEQSCNLLLMKHFQKAKAILKIVYPADHRKIIELRL